jgi:hypothetical protein
MKEPFSFELTECTKPSAHSVEGGQGSTTHNRDSLENK